MFGDDIGSLVIYTSTQANPMTEVNRVTGEQGDIWKKLSVDIAVNLQAKEWVRVIVEGVVGTGYLGTPKDFSHIIKTLLFGFLGDIAVDDIVWSPNVTCAAGDTTTTPGVPFTSTAYRKFKD